MANARLANARLRGAAAGCLVALALWAVTADAGEGDQLLATVDKPATITATRAASLSEAASPPSTRVIVSVTHYRPTDDGLPVEVVVNGRPGDGAEREIGRFGITPDREFASADPSTTQRFGFALPGELATAVAAGKPVTFSVHLIPVRGEGKGASLRVGTVEFN
jgi:hypothetical protein